MLMRTSALLGGTLGTALLMGTPAAAQSANEAQCPEGEHELVIVSWGGSWETAQEKAYYQPFMQARPNVTIVQESSSNEAVAKIRAQNEAGNVTWDLVDTLVSDAIRLCDEGLVKEIQHDEWLNPAPDGTPASEDFGDALQSDCHIPGVLHSTSVGYRTDVPEWQGRKPENICALESFPARCGPGWGRTHTAVRKQALAREMTGLHTGKSVDDIRATIDWSPYRDMAMVEEWGPMNVEGMARCLQRN